MMVAQFSFAQSFELSGGLNSSSFTSDRRLSNASNTSVNESGGRGYSFGLSYTGFKKLKNNIRVSLLVDQYEGEVSANSFGTSYRDQLNISYKKTCISAALYPFNFKLTPRTFFAFGFEINYLINHQTAGSYVGSRYQSPTTRETYDNESNNLHYNISGGASMRLHHEFHITDTWAISPQYKLFAGCTPDLNTRLTNIYAIRHSFLLGITKNLTSSD
jgi:hypothetical protein